MNRNIRHVGLDVDDTQYHGSAFNKETGEVIDFRCRPTLKGLLTQLDRGWLSIREKIPAGSAPGQAWRRLPGATRPSRQRTQHVEHGSLLAEGHAPLQRAVAQYIGTQPGLVHPRLSNARNAD
jgi:hypothetical protein